MSYESFTATNILKKYHHVEQFVINKMSNVLNLIASVKDAKRLMKIIPTHFKSPFKKRPSYNWT